MNSDENEEKLDEETPQEEPLYLEVTVDQPNQCCYGQKNREHETVYYELNGFTWPKKLTLINAHPIHIPELKKCEYYPRKTVTAAIIMSEDSDNAVGYCKCTECDGLIDFSDKFCKHCGSKLGPTKAVLRKKQ